MIKRAIIIVLFSIILCGFSPIPNKLFTEFKIDIEVGNIVLIKIDNEDNVYLLDTERQQIIKLNPQGNTLEIYGNGGRGNATFENISDFAIDKDGHLYVADFRGRVVILNTQGNIIDDWSVAAGEANFFALAIDKEKNVFVNDTLNQRIIKYNLHGQLIQEYDKKNMLGGYYDFPIGLAIGNDNLMYIGQMSEAGGIFAYDLKGNLVKKNQKCSPHNISIDARGRVYTASPNIMILNEDLSEVEYWIGNDKELFPEASDYFIYSIAANSHGKIYKVRANNEVLVCNKYFTTNRDWPKYIEIAAIVIVVTFLIFAFWRKKQK